MLDVGTFDGFYAFLAERRGAARVVALDSEEYVSWVRGRFGIDLEPGAGFRAIAGLLHSKVDYRRLDAFDVQTLGETFDVVLCFGICTESRRRSRFSACWASASRPTGRSFLRPMACAAGTMTRPSSSTSTAM